MIENPAGLTGLFFLMILQVIVPPIPAELIVIASGKMFGTVPSALTAGAGLFVGSVLVYEAGYYLHTRFDRFFNRGKIQSLLESFRAWQRWILWIRILPYNPSDIIAYAAGLAKLDRRSFWGIGLCTSFARCFWLSWMGSQIEDYKQALVVLSILAISALLAAELLRRKRYSP